MKEISLEDILVSKGSLTGEFTEYGQTRSDTLSYSRAWHDH